MRKLFGKANEPLAHPSADDTLSRSEQRSTSVFQVVDRFLEQNPSRTPFYLHALVEAGAANLMSAEELLEACGKIEQHGNIYPINPTLRKELEPHELLEFVKWHARADVSHDDYRNENTVRELIQRFYKESN